MTPFAYALRHRVYYFALDLSELDEIDRTLRLVGRDRRSVVRFRDDDHLPVPARDIDVDIRVHLRDAGFDPSGWSIVLVTNLRVFGYVFNPASFYLCRDAEGRLQVVIVEVHNTFGERHLYTLQRQPDGESFRSGMAKAFYVSPFIGLDGRYRVHVRDDARGLRIGIDLRDDDGPLLGTSLVLARRPLKDREVVRMLLRHPLITHRTIGLIHWHALRLRLRGARFLPHAGWAEQRGPSSQPGIEAP